MDRIWKETGIDERDYWPNLQRLGLQNDEEIRGILVQYHNFFDNYVKAANAEVAALQEKKKADEANALEVAKKVLSGKTAIEKQMDA